ncbi:PLD-like domain protein [Bacteriovorax sp. BAL6_X]|uniref:phospholipase D-like domain-containing protein n=1 Tax=Bacteriovorax sp. BAL6_X TaxID=1201290 RepID=UPI000386C92C|nr:phospholipase D-like domain-containing protein [Bacteriovorax sp. BAL6_X]EPZ49763.1 PLD-like domain protein [Bacteriovorax sp. BAL6_X]
MKKLLFTTLIASNIFAGASFWALFSPHQGEEAFNQIYSAIDGSKEKVWLTVYSWSDSKVAKSLEVACLSGVDVKVVLHPNLRKNSRVNDYATAIEDAGCGVKFAYKKMHEKFSIVDDKWAFNSSANLSGGAKSRYSENFIFNNDSSQEGRLTINTLNREFKFLWNSGKDIYTSETKEENLASLDLESLKNDPNEEENPFFVSSSMNFKYTKLKPSSKSYLSGRYIKMTARKLNGQKTWLVRDAMIKLINESQKNILVNVNHLVIKEVADALLDAVKRGVDVKIVADNQEYKTSTKSKEMTPYFVYNWKKLPGNKNKVAPVRIKYYSHAPSPRHWALNHHKYMLFDYDEKDFSQTKLMSGSYNISETAELTQFDNMFTYKGETFAQLFKDFKGEFDNLWFLNRDEDDRPTQEAWDRVAKPYNGNIYLHTKMPVSLTWPEIYKVRKAVAKAAPQFFRNAYKKRDCYLFNLEKQIFTGCPN